MKPVIRPPAIADLMDAQWRSSGSNIFSQALLSKVTRMTQFYIEQSVFCRTGFVPWNSLRCLAIDGDIGVAGAAKIVDGYESRDLT
jgi:hypothetical protein